MNHGPALFGFDLLSPSMLGWLAAAAAPLLIHLWSRRRYEEMPWAAMRYLLAAVKTARRRTRLEQWLLLLVRTAIIATVVLAAAEPYLELGTVPFVPGVRTHRLLVIDGSYSMGYRPGETSRFEAAKQLAARIVEESDQGDGFSLVLMADPARAVVDEPSLDPADFIAELQALRLSHTAADLAGAAACAERLLAGTARRNPKLARQEVYLLSDLGRVSWDPQRLGQKAAGQIQRRFAKIAQMATLTLIDLGQDDAGNLAVTGAAAAQTFAVRGRNIEIRGELRNFSRSPASARVQLLADGHRAAEETVNLDPGGQAAVSFSHRFETPGNHVLEIAAPGDRLEIDNHRWIALAVRPAVRVLCVNGQPSGPKGSATDYLATALAPAGDGMPAAGIQPEVVAESLLVETDLGRYDCVFLVNVAQFTRGEGLVLDNYLKSGGGVVFFLGDRVRPEQYNQILGGMAPGAFDILPARLQPAPVEKRQMLNPLEYRHPIIEVFRGQERAGLLATPVEKHFPLEVPAESASQVVLALDDGTPLVVERPVHRGRVILIGTSADTAWTPMPLLPSYVPIIQEILAYAVAQRQQRRNVLVGESIGAALTRFQANGLITIKTPDGRSETAPLDAAGGVAGWNFASTDPSGIYMAFHDGEAETPELFAVNVDPKESDLAKLSEMELRRGVLADVPFQLHGDGHRLATQHAGVTTRSGGLAKPLLYLLLGLLLLETYLARRFGHHAP
jgi:hypothetical protein